MTRKKDLEIGLELTPIFDTLARIKAEVDETVAAHEAGQSPESPDYEELETKFRLVSNRLKDLAAMTCPTGGTAPSSPSAVPPSGQARTP